MKTPACFILMICLAAACTSRHETYSANFDSKNRKKQIVYPPQPFIDAVFAYKKKHFQWPDQLDNLCTNITCLQEYRTFIDRGIEKIGIHRSTRDTLLLDFTYSRRKNGAYYGKEYEKLPLKDITGLYEFVHDSNFVFFRVILTRPKLFSVSIK